jgi:hypothetical protein
VANGVDDQLGPGSEVQSGEPLRNLPLTPTEHPIRTTPSSAYVRSQAPCPTLSAFNAPVAQLDSVTGADGIQASNLTLFPVMGYYSCDSTGKMPMNPDMKR